MNKIVPLGRDQARIITLRGLIAAGMAITLAACASGPPSSAPVSTGGFGPERPGAPMAGGVERANRTSRPGLTPPYLVGRPITRVGLMLPFVARPSDAESFANAAELALFDQGYDELLLMPREEGSDPRLAEAEARALLRDGADVIIGPLFAGPVAGATRAAREASVPMIAFSTDSRLAGDGIYLMNFAIEQEVSRVVSYAARNGVLTLGLLAPGDDYGRRVELALQEAVARSGGRLAVSRFYARNDADVNTNARAFAVQARAMGVQGVMIADGGSRLRVAATALLTGGLDLRRVKLLGTGEWSGVELQREPTLLGGWFPAADPTIRANFEQRYQQAYGKAPSRLAGLAYDAVSLSAALTRSTGYSGLTAAALQRSDGFIGVDGPFRFRPNGVIERGLAVLEVRQGGPQVIDAAPQRLADPPQG